MLAPRTFRTAFPALLFSLLAATAFAQSPTGSPPAPTASGKGTTTQGGSNLSRGDSKFVEKALAHGAAEVELGRLAQQKGSSPQVKDFGARMVQDHGKAGDELKSIAASKGLAPAGTPDKDHQKKLAKLQEKSGADFDKAYMRDMVADHKKDVADFRKEAKSAKDPDMKAFAAKALPTLEEHLKLAQDTDKAVRSGGKEPAKTAAATSAPNNTAATPGSKATGNTTSTK